MLVIIKATRNGCQQECLNSQKLCLIRWKQSQELPYVVTLISSDLTMHLLYEMSKLYFLREDSLIPLDDNWTPLHRNPPVSHDSHPPAVASNSSSNPTMAETVQRTTQEVSSEPL